MRVSAALTFPANSPRCSSGATGAVSENRRQPHFPLAAWVAWARRRVSLTAATRFFLPPAKACECRFSVEFGTKCSRQRCTATICHHLRSPKMPANDAESAVMPPEAVRRLQRSPGRPSWRVELERTSVLVRNDEAKVDILAGLGCELLGRLCGLNVPMNRNRVAIKRHLSTPSRLRAFANDRSVPAARSTFFVRVDAMGFATQDGTCAFDSNDSMHSMRSSARRMSHKEG